MRKISFIFTVLWLSPFCTVADEPSGASEWAPVQRITFLDEELPPNLYSVYTGDDKDSYVQYCLPADYNKGKTYPLILYVPGFHGHPGGNIDNARDIGNGHECIVASLPLFKEHVDRSEVANGVIVSFSDYPVLSKAYKTILERFYQTIPNVDRTRSSMVGFSNGAITIGVLLSMHDTYLLERFQNFCLVDHGMFHLADLHKSLAKDRRYLILVGDQEDFGRELKLRGARLIEDSYKMLNINIESRILGNTGHELTAECKKDIGNWIFQRD